MNMLTSCATVTLAFVFLLDPTEASSIQREKRTLQIPLIKFPLWWNREKWCKRYKDKFCDDINFRDMTNDRAPPTCKNGKCAGVEYDTIKKMYKGMFLTQSQINNLRETYIPRITGNTVGYSGPRSSMTIYSDWDKCCPTQHDFAQMYGTMRNIDNQTRTIVHFPDKKPAEYQAAHVGNCVAGGECKSCMQSTKLVSLLVIDPTYSCFPPFMMDTFEVNSHCVCKDLGNSY